MNTMTRSLSQPQRYGPRNTFHVTADSPFAMTWVSAHSPVTSGVHTGIAAQPTPSPRGAGSGGAGAGRSGSFLSTQNIRRYHFPGPLLCTLRQPSATAARSSADHSDPYRTPSNLLDGLWDNPARHELHVDPGHELCRLGRMKRSTQPASTSSVPPPCCIGRHGVFKLIYHGRPPGGRPALRTKRRFSPAARVCRLGSSLTRGPAADQTPFNLPPSLFLSRRAPTFPDRGCTQLISDERSMRSVSRVA